MFFFAYIYVSYFIVFDKLNAFLPQMENANKDLELEIEKGNLNKYKIDHDEDGDETIAKDNSESTDRTIEFV